MTLEEVVAWMLDRLKQDGCLYQDDVVDKLIYSGATSFTRENDDGNVVVGSKVLSAFRAATEPGVVWVKPDRYWRWRVSTDEPGREARG